jgi:hypothetical protein
VFALVFRTQAAYGRFVDGCVAVTSMSSRWGDAAMCLITFETQAWEGPDGTPAEARASAVRAQVGELNPVSAVHGPDWKGGRASRLWGRESVPGVPALT